MFPDYLLSILLQTIIECINMVMSAGGTFMIIDMGGGTVDMTIHKVGAVMGEEMTLTEVTHRECLPEVRNISVAVGLGSHQVQLVV